MSRIIVLFGLLMFLAAGWLAFGYPRLANTVVADRSAARNALFAVDRSFLDLGTMDNDGIAFSRVIVRNVSSVPIQLTARSRCGCFKGLLSGRTVGSGEAVPLAILAKAYLRPESQQDRLTQDVLLLASTEGGRVASQQITGTVAVVDRFRVMPQGATAHRSKDRDGRYVADLQVVATSDAMVIDSIEGAASDSGEEVVCERRGDNHVRLHLPAEAFDESGGTLVVLRLTVGAEKTFLLVPLVKEEENEK
ncbi:MAG: hypothetical protein JW955_22100 [Sedimentisphaerales bacterium]|nr:hypothetical protein [Sedimentisphaerales bacterium]